jgi:hypothetical protein
MKKLKPGDTIIKEGYFYTPEEHEKNLERKKAIEDIRNYIQK